MSDLIRREDAIKAFTFNSKGERIPFVDCDNFPVEFPLRYIVDTLVALLPADRPQEWIPCSDRLPKIGEKVLASTKKTVFTQVFKGYYSDPKRWAWENNRVKEIEAWQPLPKPWKGADDGNK